MRHGRCIVCTARLAAILGLINLVCDRALVTSFSAHETTIDADVVDRAAAGLGLDSSGGMTGTVLGWMRRRVAAL